MMPHLFPLRNPDLLLLPRTSASPSSFSSSSPVSPPSPSLPPPEMPSLSLDPNNVQVCKAAIVAFLFKFFDFFLDLDSLTRNGVPCKISFSTAGVRDIYMIPVAKGVSGKLILVEKHPFNSRRGIVLAMAPLTRLSKRGLLVSFSTSPRRISAQDRDDRDDAVEG